MKQQFESSSALIVKSLLWPFFTLMLIGFLYYLSSPFFSIFSADLYAKSKLVLAYTVGVTLWITLAWFICRLIRVFIWEMLIQNRFSIQVPQLIKEIVNIIVYFTIILGMISFLFHQSIIGLLAATGAMSLVIGLSIENLIADLFYGVVMSIDRPFSVDDNVFLHGKQLNLAANVVEITWRSTYFRTLQQEILSIPNSVLASMIITNKTMRNAPNYMFYKGSIVLDDRVPIKRALRLLEASILSIPGVSREPYFLINIEKMEQGGIFFKLNFFYETTVIKLPQVIHCLNENLLHNLSAAKIKFFLPKQKCFDLNQPIENLSDKTPVYKAIERVSFFQFLSQNELDYLNKKAKTRSYAVAEKVVALGEPGDSMFIVLEGLLEVLIVIPDEKDQVRVAYLSAGQIFGEMSLLTGEPRTASVVCKTACTLIEITKKNLAPILKKNEDLLVNIGRIISEREMQRVSKTQEFETNKAALTEIDSFSDALIKKIKNFFSLSSKG